ncbi:3-oxoacyl-[acyl-carrier-protein] reductase [Colletotrichum higginsianum]|uniref:3-oxoacyl-[acyl-carrier-protein] reductase n=1 Tax=Colletotrichum higginsianum (strain IMI 349063) TaxID=759273 RepID=H1VID7_COLHI|nr:3-oxoacyl-[acyl-carrier-protein] reductase [Colletotrichum higginsianum]
MDIVERPLSSPADLVESAAGAAAYFVRKGLSNLAITYVSNKAAANKTLEQCRKLGIKNTIAIQADATDSTVGPRVIKEVLSGLNVTTIDILVNNAVIPNDRTRDLKTLQAEDFNELMVGNVYFPVSLTVAFIEHAPKYGGRVINLSSMAGKTGNPEAFATYGATKAALESFTRSFADSFSLKTGITFNSISVGPTETEALQGAREDYAGEYIKEQIKLITAAPRSGSVDDIAYIIGFLASEEGRWVNGALIPANGGHKMTLALFG